MLAFLLGKGGDPEPFGRFLNVFFFLSLVDMIIFVSLYYIIVCYFHVNLVSIHINIHISICYHFVKVNC